MAKPERASDPSSNWYLAQDVADDYATLASRLTLSTLLNVYSDRLSTLRDQSARRSRWRRPVRDARRFDEYLITDGHDAVTLASDIADLTERPNLFAHWLPDFIERRSLPPAKTDEGTPLRLSLALCDQLREQATRLAREQASTTANIRASAELRQAIANTRLQRIVITVSVLALVVAIVALVTQSG